VDAACSRYYKNPERKLLKLWMLMDGATRGDIGAWDEQGRLKVIDRLKNIFKLQGEYITPGIITSLSSLPFLPISLFQKKLRLFCFKYDIVRSLCLRRLSPATLVAVIYPERFHLLPGQWELVTGKSLC
jgi:hypothetical protein